MLSERGLPASLCAQGDMHHQGEAVQQLEAAGAKVSPPPRIWGTLWVWAQGTGGWEVLPCLHCGIWKLPCS